ncbi:MAG: rRNA methyltransferase [Candidatus Saccharibacteria bacterium]|nr:rRNA methyltransferase [Candidatus Saccharibacteria bacterium]
MIRILAIGKKHEAWVQTGIERYQKRLKKPFAVEWVLLPHSAKNGSEARQNESQTLLSRLTSSDFVILLDETGTMYDSPSLSDRLASAFSTRGNVTVIIGGAYGVSEELHRRAQLVWSLSPLVFPHQLVRLLLVEQLYRAQEIAAGHPYHHE